MKPNNQLQPGASTNGERIEAMRELHGFCDLYKVGVISGKGKDFYNPKHMTHFWDFLAEQMRAGQKIYIKDSLIFQPQTRKFSERVDYSDYNIFNSDTE